MVGLISYIVAPIHPPALFLDEDNQTKTNAQKWECTNVGMHKRGNAVVEFCVTLFG